MKLYRVSHWSHGLKLYACRAPLGVKFTVHHASATLYRHAEATGIARRFRKLQTRMRLEPVRRAA